MGRARTASASQPGAVFRVLLGLLYLGAFGLLAYLAWQGRTYYLAPLLERPRHPLYWQLKPGGSRGLLYGMAGAGLMVIMLTYSLRKRIPWLRKAGSLAHWLDFHIFCGVVGPLFILLHSSFKVGGLVALSFWSMVAVAGSGIFGRFLYRQIPRRRSGDELSLAEVEEMTEKLASVLASDFGLAEADLERLSKLASEDAGGGLLRLLLRLPFDGLRARRRVDRFLAGLPPTTPALARRLRATIGRRLWLERRIVLWSRLQGLFHYWHVFHKPFAIIMYVFMVVHIVVATATGYSFERFVR